MLKHDWSAPYSAALSPVFLPRHNYMLDYLSRRMAKWMRVRYELARREMSLDEGEASLQPSSPLYQSVAGFINR